MSILSYSGHLTVCGYDYCSRVLRTEYEYISGLLAVDSHRSSVWIPFRERGAGHP